MNSNENLQVGTGSAIHAMSVFDGVLCGGTRNSRRQVIRKVVAEVTCQKCLKLDTPERTARDLAFKAANGL
jgi:hypothetical protein